MIADSIYPATNVLLITDARTGLALNAAPLFAPIDTIVTQYEAEADPRVLN